ncbi:MAG: PepSY-like domain-containing protein [Alistipes sp.]|nr:PepSY-like domain-containing protein [Alistipes sp.]
MKRFIAILAISLALSFSAKAEERPIDVGQLPTTTLNFLSTHFASADVAFATVERELLDTDYEVRLTDGTTLDFDGRGNWTEISNKRSGVASTILPSAVGEYTSAQYPGEKFIKVERNRHGYEVKLTNGLELHFTNDGKMIGYDD